MTDRQQHHRHASAAAEALGELIGLHGRLEAEYRIALDSGHSRPKDVWAGVQKTLHDALGLVSALSAGHTDPPIGSGGLADKQPCQRCGGGTYLAIYGTAWHYSCWEWAGCPVEPIESAEEIADQPHTTTATDGTAAEPAADVEVSDVAATGGEDASAAETEDTDPAAAGGQGGEWQRRRTAREESRTAGWQVDPDEEIADWRRACRGLPGYAEASDAECDTALQAWHRRVLAWDDKAGSRSVGFRSSPAATGLLMYELIAARNGSMVQPEALQDPTVWAISFRDGERLAGTIWSFTDPDVEVPVGGAWTELDVNAQYLAAASSVECGDGEPDHISGEQLQPRWLDRLVKVPGYVQLAAAPDLSVLPGAARHSLADLDAGTWLPIPVLKYLTADKRAEPIEVELERAIVWPQGKSRGSSRFGRRLAQWAERVRAARSALGEDAAAGEPGAALALAVLKRCYAGFLGGMLRSEKDNDRGSLRPDWHDQLVATAGVNALRALDKAGLAPFAGLKDAFYFAHDNLGGPFEPDGLRIGDQPGGWHVNRWGEITTDIATAHADGRPGLVQRHARHADAHRREDT